MKFIHQIGMAATAGVALTVSSCSTGGSSPSGFLPNFSQLDGGYGTDDAVSAYFEPGVNLKKYNSVIIDPVTTVVSASGVTPEVKNQLAAYLDASLRSNAPASMKVVSAPGPTTLRIRTALTDVITKDAMAPPVSRQHPSPIAKLSGPLGSDEVAAFMSVMSFEGEILDSVTGERLGALADHRHGVKREVSASTTWSSVRNWTEKGASRLWKRFEAARAH